MAEVFISYSQKDRALVAPIAARLEELGVDAWYDREISAGERFGAVIRARLKEAKAVLACWSPEAIQSDWVEAEADYARELGTYVPVFVAPCALMPPFNRIHTDDLSKWTGESNDPTWIKLVERIAKVIGREGVAAAARALAAGDEQARYDFARRYPDEPTARKIWNGAEAGHREHFAKRMAEAKSAADAKIDAARAALEARVEAVPPAFEVWLTDERRGVAKEPMPDPLALIEKAQSGQDSRLRDEITSLQSALARTKASVGDMSAAKAEIARLSSDLAALKARESLEATEHADKQHFRDEIANLEGALDQARANEAELNAEAAGLSAQLAAARAARSRPWVLVALIGLVAAGAGALAERSVLMPGTEVAIRAKEEAEGKAAALADLSHESDGLKAQVGRLSDELSSAHASLDAANEKQTGTQARADSLVKELQDARAHASNLERELAEVDVKPSIQTLPAAQALSTFQGPPVVSKAEKQSDESGWFVVVGSSNSESEAEANLSSFRQRCDKYGSLSRIVKTDDLGLTKGYWLTVLGLYPNATDMAPVLGGAQKCVRYFFPYVEHGKLP